MSISSTPPIMKHLLDFDTLKKEDILFLLDRSKFFSSAIEHQSNLSTLHADKMIMSLFYEPSTRTHYSFNIAAQKLGAHYINPNMLTLSDQKGESLIDTIHSFEAMGVNLFIIRHRDNHIPHFIASEMNTNGSIINAGDGTNQHPSQTLIDLLTIQQCKQRLSDLTIAIVGDIQHSRVAHSFLGAAETLKIGQIQLTAPRDFLPSDLDYNLPITMHSSINEGLKNADVIMTLRIQRERMEDQEIPNLVRYSSQYKLTEENLMCANKGAIILHPGPVVRGTEIDSDIADSDQSKILQQVKNSTPVRMAIIDTLLNRV